MFELKFKRFAVIFDFSFFAAISVLMLLSNRKYLFLGFAACLWHELGHLIFMSAKRIKIDKIVFYGAGIKIVPDKSFNFTGIQSQFFVLSAGCAFNFVLYIILNNSSNAAIKIFAVLNAGICAFNLLPLQFLDGGKLLILLIYKLCNYNNAVIMERYIKWLNARLIIVTLLFVSLIGKGNVTLFITLCYLLISTLSYK